jgi:hypothetical protein
MVTPTGVILDCGGCTNFQHIREGGVDVVLQCSPIEGG